MSASFKVFILNTWEADIFCEFTFNFFDSPNDAFGFLQRVWIVTKFSWMSSELTKRNILITKLTTSNIFICWRDSMGKKGCLRYVVFMNTFYMLGGKSYQ